MNEGIPEHVQPTAAVSNPNPETPEIGGGLPVIKYWAEQTLSPKGGKLWQTLAHKSACLSYSWGTGGQKGGFTNEVGEKLQCYMKSVEAISAENPPPIPPHYFEQYRLGELQQLTSLEAARLDISDLAAFKSVMGKRFDKNMEAKLVSDIGIPYGQ